MADDNTFRPQPRLGHVAGGMPFTPDPDLMEAVPEKDIEERNDAVMQTWGFRAHIKAVLDERLTLAPEAVAFMDFIKPHLKNTPKAYDYDRYLELITEKASPLHVDEILTSLAYCEAEWRAEMVARKQSALGLGIASQRRENMLTWRGPAPDAVCGFIRADDGKECKELAVPGSPRCQAHGGALVNAEVRRAYLFSAYAAVVEGAEKAVKSLIDIVESSRSDMARVAAAKEILDRAGLTPTLNVNLKIGSDPQVVSQLQSKLDDIQRNLTVRTIDVSSVMLGESSDPEVDEAPADTSDEDAPDETVPADPPNDDAKRAITAVLEAVTEAQIASPPPPTPDTVVTRPPLSSPAPPPMPRGR